MNAHKRAPLTAPLNPEEKREIHDGSRYNGVEESWVHKPRHFGARYFG